jgi:hypothetical protein
MPPTLVDPALFSDKPLLLVPCMIGGETREGDYAVMCDGRVVGRIMCTQKAFGRVVWEWTITGPVMPPEMGNASGVAGSKDDAKTAVRTVFDRWRVYSMAQPGFAVWLE